MSKILILVVAIVALLVLGPDKLPDLAQRAGRAYRELQRLREHLHLDLDDLLADHDPSPQEVGSSRPVAAPCLPTAVPKPATPRPARHHPPRRDPRPGIIEP